MTAHDFVRELIGEALRIERQKNCRALTEDEAATVKAVGFLRQIAPYMFADGQRPTNLDTESHPSEPR